jgi:hypothetical protein
MKATAITDRDVGFKDSITAVTFRKHDFLGNS